MKFPWASLMYFGLGVLRLSPDQFWRSTLRELQAARGSLPSPLLRQNLNSLMQHFPD
jgi:uncharacterized phage protein (TIGR02216 family)